jgi:hypothetical protein
LNPKTRPWPRFEKKNSKSLRVSFFREVRTPYYNLVEKNFELRDDRDVEQEFKYSRGAIETSLFSNENPCTFYKICKAILTKNFETKTKKN